MELTEQDTPELELVTGWAIDIVPMLGASVFTFRSIRLEAEGEKTGPERDLVPMTLTLEQLELLERELPKLRAAMVQAGIRKSGAPAGGPRKN